MTSKNHEIAKFGFIDTSSPEVFKMRHITLVNLGCSQPHRYIFSFSFVICPDRLASLRL